MQWLRPCTSEISERGSLPHEKPDVDLIDIFLLYLERVEGCDQGETGVREHRDNAETEHYFVYHS